MSEEVNRGLRWLVFVTMFIATATTSIFLIAPAPMLGEIMKTMPQLSPNQVIFIIMSVFNISIILAAILGGPLLDKFGVMKVYIGGLIIIGFGALLTPLIGSSSWGMILIRSLQGIGAGPILVSVIPIAARYFPPKQRSILIVLQGLAVTSGVQIGIMLIPRTVQETGNWQTSLAWLAPICILGLIFSFIVTLTSKSPKGAISRTKTPFMKDINNALQNPATYIVIVCAAMFTWINQALNDLLPTYLSSAPPVGLGYDPASSGWLMSAATGAMFCGGFIGALITEKLLKGNARPVVLSGFALGAISIYLLNVPAMASNHLILGICVCAIFFFLGSTEPLAFGHIAKYYPEHITGTIGGLMMGTYVFIGMASVTVCSEAMEISGYHMSFILLVGVAIIGAFAALFLKPVKQG